MTYKPSRTGVSDQAKLDMQHQIETRFIEAKSRQLELAQARYSRPPLLGRPPVPRLLSRLRHSTTTSRREERLRAMLETSGLFDGEWYLRQYPDVAEAGLQPVDHYLKHGADEMRDPGPAFSTRHYLALYPDIREAGVNPLAHYVESGWEEMRVIRPSIHAEERAH